MGRCLCGGLQILILIAAGLQIQQNKEFPTQEDFICRDAINRVSTDTAITGNIFSVRADLQSDLTAAGYKSSRTVKTKSPYMKSVLCLGK